MACMNCNHCDKKDDLVYETKHYKIYLYDQSYLGRCAIVSKRHIQNLSECTSEEQIDFFKVVALLEKSMKKAFNATMFNWTCLMNHAYRAEKPNPHLQWHFRPRYKETAIFAGEKFTDPDFGEHYDETRKKNISKETKEQIIKEIQKQILNQK